MTALTWTATARAALLVGLLVAGLGLAVIATPPSLAHEQTSLVAASGTGRCPSSVENCRQTWTHINSWTHYTARVPSNCNVEIIDQCGIQVTSRSATSSCQNSSSCGHGPHNSTPRPTGPGTWTQWNGHSNTNYRWSGQRRVPVDHEHGSLSPTPEPYPTSTVPSPTPDPSPTPLPEGPPAESPIFDPGDIDWTNFNPCGNGGCLPSCMTDNIADNCPWETPPPKVCASSWSNAQRLEVLGHLRWESVVPYSSSFSEPHHPEVPGGDRFLTAASTATSPVLHWTAQQPGTTLDVLDAPVDGCLWTATAVGVSLRELLPNMPGDLAKLRSSSYQAARDAAALWGRLTPERRQWYQAAFPRVNPSIVWCPPADLAPWTVPTNGVLTLPANWHDRHGACRWSIPRRGFWEWQLRVKYTSEQGDLHTEILAADLSWFREPTGYLGQQVTLW